MKYLSAAWLTFYLDVRQRWLQLMDRGLWYSNYWNHSVKWRFENCVAYVEEVGLTWYWTGDRSRYR